MHLSCTCMHLPCTCHALASADKAWQVHGKCMASAWQLHGNRVATARGKCVANAWQDLPRTCHAAWQVHGKCMAMAKWALLPVFTPPIFARAWCSFFLIVLPTPWQFVHFGLSCVFLLRTPLRGGRLGQKCCNLLVIFWHVPAFKNNRIAAVWCVFLFFAPDSRDFCSKCWCVLPVLLFGLVTLRPFGQFCHCRHHVVTESPQLCSQFAPIVWLFRCCVVRFLTNCGRHAAFPC